MEANLNRIEADLKLADLTVPVAVTVTRGFETAHLAPVSSEGRQSPETETSPCECR